MQLAVMATPDRYILFFKCWCCSFALLLAFYTFTSLCFYLKRNCYPNDFICQLFQMKISHPHLKLQKVTDFCVNHH